MKIKEVRELETNELVEKLENAKSALETLKLNHQISPLENPSQIKAARRDIARMMTELNSRNK
jgi:large subunit ribosomal protein L29